MENHARIDAFSFPVARVGSGSRSRSTRCAQSLKGERLGLERMTFDHFILDGFSKELTIGSDVLTRDPVKIVNSNF